MVLVNTWRCLLTGPQGHFKNKTIHIRNWVMERGGILKLSDFRNSVVRRIVAAVEVCTL